MRCFYKSLFLFTCYISAYVQITTDSYEEVEKICLNNPDAVIVFDLFDVGIQYKNSNLFQENKASITKKLYEELIYAYKVRACLKGYKEEGFIEIKAFIDLYNKLSFNKNLVCICSEKGYVPSYQFVDFALFVHYDSYLHGVLFYRANLLDEIVQKIIENNKKIIFITSSSNTIKKLKCNNTITFILFKIKR